MFYPPVSGGKILAFNHVRFLSQFYEVEILTPEPKEKHQTMPGDVLSQLGKVHYVDLAYHRLTKGPDSLSYMLRNYPRAVFARYPIVDIYDFYGHPDVQKLIKDDFDLIQLFHSWFFHPFLNQRRGKLFLVQHNYEYEYWRQMALALVEQKKYFRGLCYWLGSGKIFRQEKEAVNAAYVVLALSERERKIFQQVYGLKERCHVVNPGIDIAPFQVLQDIDLTSDGREPFSMIYVGSLNTPQHAAGVISFIKDVYPLLKKVLPLGCCFCLVGADPVDAIKQLADHDPSITLTGFVSDVKPWIRKADLYIVPLTYGSGIRFKIMEAMAMGKPVVSTKKGAEGLEIEKAGVIVVDEIRDFVSAISALAIDRKALLRMGKDNRSYAIENFNCERIFINKILPIYQALIKLADA